MVSRESGLFCSSSLPVTRKGKNQQWCWRCFNISKVNDKTAGIYGLSVEPVLHFVSARKTKASVWEWESWDVRHHTGEEINFALFVLLPYTEEKGRNPLVAGALWFSISVVTVGGTRRVGRSSLRKPEVMRRAPWAAAAWKGSLRVLTEDGWQHSTPCTALLLLIGWEGRDGPIAKQHFHDSSHLQISNAFKKCFIKSLLGWRKWREGIEWNSRRATQKSVCPSIPRHPCLPCRIVDGKSQSVDSILLSLGLRFVVLLVPWLFF